MREFVKPNWRRLSATFHIIEWLCGALGFTEHLRAAGPGGSVNPALYMSRRLTSISTMPCNAARGIVAFTFDELNDCAISGTV